ncbi:hypothetical protein KIN20_016420 [Parelaphostrongylus tenuis]|uniref:Uncharacterized protein n=1 Tax=Parelaphostrongylus tenuis TaxID=148309 RepID=A0AAD5QMX9_PARTN|nr:hypothetical protein KIN20_016420 [Parelaphostrongylus tenuis]
MKLILLLIPLRRNSITMSPDDPTAVSHATATLRKMTFFDERLILLFGCGYVG